MKTFAYRLDSSDRSPIEYFVLLHTAASPDPITWDRYVDALATRIAQTKRPIHVFAVTDGGGPDPRQRSALAEAFARDQRGSMTHVFTTNPLTRGIVTAFQWLARTRVSAYPPEAFGSVCEGLSIPASAVLDELSVVQKELPPVELLARIGAIVRSPR